MTESDIRFDLTSAEFVNATGMPRGPIYTVIQDKPEIETDSDPIYFLFMYGDYDADGGINDFVAGVSSLSLAFLAYEQHKELHPYDADNAHIAILGDDGQLHIYLEYRDDYDHETLTVNRGWKKPKPKEDNN